jgi:hypothetical protein
MKQHGLGHCPEVWMCLSRLVWTFKGCGAAVACLPAFSLFFSFECEDHRASVGIDMPWLALRVLFVNLVVVSLLRSCFKPHKEMVVSDGVMDRLSQ